MSSTHGIATQEGVEIQKRDQNSTAKEGHNSTKNPLNIDPGSVFNEGINTGKVVEEFIATRDSLNPKGLLLKSLRTHDPIGFYYQSLRTD